MRRPSGASHPPAWTGRRWRSTAGTRRWSVPHPSKGRKARRSKRSRTGTPSASPKPASSCWQRSRPTRSAPFAKAKPSRSKATFPTRRSVQRSSLARRKPFRTRPSRIARSSPAAPRTIWRLAPRSASRRSPARMTAASRCRTTHTPSPVARRRRRPMQVSTPHSVPSRRALRSASAPWRHPSRRPTRWRRTTTARPFACQASHRTEIRALPSRRPRGKPCPRRRS